MELPVGSLAGQRGDVDHLAPARGAQVLRRGHRHLPGSEDVHLEDAAPHLGGGRLEIVVGDHLGGAGVVDQDVEPPVAVAPPRRPGAGPGPRRRCRPGCSWRRGSSSASASPAATDVDELTTTVAPSAANRWAVAAPIPDDDPVTSTTWPCEGGGPRGGSVEGGLDHGPSVGPGWPTFSLCDW